ncbi:hypothetical protein BJF82_05300 [Kytococcus sp. CUA-901]|nr:hypothetical protein BJF82_05300 [Kytococcus sp. CUA-901]
MTLTPTPPVTVPPEATAEAVRTALAPVLAGERELALGTSGSTGSPARALLRGADLTASATATHERLGGPGRWVLALPPGHIAGVQVLVRAAVAGIGPLVTTGAEGSFDPARLTADLTAAREADPTTRTYLSLVPTQVARLTEDPATACAVTAATDAVLVGGAALPAAVAERAATAGLPVVRTYGSTETCGGCVYDGLPLPGVEIGTTAEGRVTLTAPWVTRGWLVDGELVTSRAHAGGQRPHRGRTPRPRRHPATYAHHRRPRRDRPRRPPAHHRPRGRPHHHRRREGRARPRRRCGGPPAAGGRVRRRGRPGRDLGPAGDGRRRAARRAPPSGHAP